MGVDDIVCVFGVLGERRGRKKRLQPSFRNPNYFGSGLQWGRRILQTGFRCKFYGRLILASYLCFGFHEF
jgi:hypothetical protein